MIYYLSQLIDQDFLSVCMFFFCVCLVDALVHQFNTEQ